MDRKPIAAIFITILLFSTIEVAVKSLPSGSVDPMLLAVLRFGVAGVLMVGLQWKTIKSVSARHWMGIIAIGVIGLAGTFGPYHFVLESAEASQVALIFSLNPVFASLFAIPFLKEKVTPYQIGALFLGFIGVYIVSFGFSPIQFDSVRDPLLMLWTAICFGGYTTMNKRMVRHYGPLFTTGAAFIFAALALLPLVHNFTVGSVSKAVPILLYLIFGTTFVGYLFYFDGLKRVNVATGTALFYLKPVLATLLSVIILHERPALQFYAGMVIIFAALSLSLKKGKK